MNIRFRLVTSLQDSNALDEVARIGRTIVDGWHEWAEPSPDDTSFSSYFSLNPTHYEVAVRSFTAHLLYPATSSRTIEVAETASSEPAPAVFERETTLPLDAAALVLTEPLAILVENERNDGRFLLTLVAPVDAGLVRMFLERRPRVRVQNGGGKAEIARLVEHRADESRRAGIPLRALIVVDGDAQWPRHRSSETRKLERICSATGAALYVLRKRAIENYVPDRVLAQYADAYPDVRPSTTFVCGLSATARDHFPMKKGLSVDGSGSVVASAEEERQVYAGLTFPTGFVPKLPRLIEFFFSSDVKLTESDLQLRDAVGEVGDLARTIRGEL